MGKIRLSFALMLLAALMVLLAGERLARRELTIKEEADRVGIEEFTLDLRGELSELDDDLKDHLWGLAMKCKEGEDVKNLIDQSTYLRSAYLIERNRQVKEWIPIPKADQKSAPEMIAEGSDMPLNEKTAVLVSQHIIDDAYFGQTGWLASSDEQHRLLWVCPQKGMIVGFMADFDVIAEGVKEKITQWGSERFSIFHEARKKAVLVAQDRSRILGLAGEGTPDVSMPLQTPMGSFWLRAWDDRKTTRWHHRPTLAAAGILAALLAGAGWLMMQSQRRAWLEAEERVSFANRVSHELGTPLTNMTLNLDLASRSLRSDPEKAGSRLEKVREEVARLTRLVGNVLTRTRKERGLLEEAPAAAIPDEVIGSVLEQFRPALERRSIEVEFTKGASETLLIDSDALSQIVWNLISNVEKHAAQGRTLDLITSLKDGRLIVSVGDEGPGISEGDQVRIFSAFERVHDGVTEGVSGTGLGRAISRDLAAMMRGSLELMPCDQGTLFRLSVPAVTS